MTATKNSAILVVGKRVIKLDWFEKLRALKAASNMSMREIAAKSGIPEPTLEKIFSGATKSPGVNTIQSLVHALGYTLNDIDSGQNKNSPRADESAPEEEQLDTDPLRTTLLQNFDQLNQEGRERLVETSDDMVSSGKYIKSNTDKLGSEKYA